MSESEIIETTESEIPKAASEARIAKKYELIRTTPEAFTTLALFKERYPKTFFDDPDKIVPLKLRIHKKLLKALKGEVSQDSIRRAITIYVTRTAYLEKLTVEGAQRFDLEGNPYNDVKESHAESARATLKTFKEKGLEGTPLEPMAEEKLAHLKDPKPKQPPSEKKAVKQPSDKVVKKKETAKLQPPKPEAKSVSDSADSVARRLHEDRPTLSIKRRRKPKLHEDKPTLSIKSKLHEDKPTLSIRRKPK